MSIFIAVTNDLDIAAPRSSLNLIVLHLRHMCVDSNIMKMCDLLLLLLPILCRATSSAALSHTGGFRVGGGVHDSYTFQCGLVGSFTSPGIDTI